MINIELLIIPFFALVIVFGLITSIPVGSPYPWLIVAVAVVGIIRKHIKLKPRKQKRPEPELIKPDPIKPNQRRIDQLTSAENDLKIALAITNSTIAESIETIDDPFKPDREKRIATDRQRSALIQKAAIKQRIAKIENDIEKLKTE